MLFAEAAEIAQKAETGGLLLTHFSTSMEDPEVFLPAAREIFEKTWAAKDGETVTMRYPEKEEKAWTSLC
jgi:ribonuclease Z